MGVGGFMSPLILSQNQGWGRKKRRFFEKKTEKSFKKVGKKKKMKKN